MIRKYLSTAQLLATLILGAVTSVSVTGCEDTAALTATKTTAFAKLTEAQSKLSSALSTLDAAAKKLDALPAATPGLADVKAKLAAQKTNLDKLKATFDGFGSKFEEAAKSGSKEALETVVKALDTNVASLGPIETAVEDASKSVASLETAAVAAAAPATPPSSSFDRKLSTGYEIKAASDGVEHGLVGFVEDAQKPVDKTTWFNFDQLTFKTGGAEIDMDKSKTQLDNVIEILKAFPKVKIKIGGYTDNTGAAAANKKISQSRADAVKKAIVAGGVAANRLEAEGYGPEHPVCEANDTDECKAQNRRIAIRVTAK